MDEFDDLHPSDSPSPILMAGGFMPVPIKLTAPRDHFNYRGYRTSVVSFRYRDMRDIRTYAKHIREKLGLLCRAYECKRVTFLGFSLGGLAGLYAAKHLGAAARIDNFIAIGAPFRGASLGWLAMMSGFWTTLGLQIRPGSPFLKELHADPLPKGPSFVSIRGNRDAVCPAPTSILNGAKNVELDFSHLEFFGSESLFSEIETYF